MAAHSVHEKDVREEAPRVGADSTATILGRLTGSLPEHYREEVTRLVHRVRDRLPPAIIEHRLDALEQHVDRRLGAIEEKIEEVLRRLAKLSR